MKTKIWSVLIMFVAIGLFSSCEGPMGPEGPSGVGDWEILEKKVSEGEWIRDRDNGVFYYVLRDNRIDESFVTEGIVNVELIDGGAFYPLPLTEYFYNNGYFAETISYSYGPGWIRFSIGANDLFDEAGDNYQPMTHYFKITLLW